MGALMRQYELRDGATTTTAWLESDSRLCVGARVTMKTSRDPDRLWTIVRRGEHELDQAHIHQDWNVGGVTEGRRRERR